MVYPLLLSPTHSKPHALIHPCQDYTTKHSSIKLLERLNNLYLIFTEDLCFVGMQD